MFDAFFIPKFHCVCLQHHIHTSKNISIFGYQAKYYLNKQKSTKCKMRMRMFDFQTFSLMVVTTNILGYELGQDIGEGGQAR